MSETNYVRQLLDGSCGDDPKARIIRAALEEIAVRSIEGARTREIAAKANVNLAAINYYFNGKRELYLELNRQIAEAINFFHAGHYAEAEAIFKKPDAEKAHRLLLEFLLYRFEESSQNPASNDIILILMKEEFYPTEAFDILYKTAFVRLTEIKRRLVEIASEGRIVGEQANLVSAMLYGQIRVFYSCRMGIMRANKWKNIGPAEIKKITSAFTSNLEKILKP